MENIELEKRSENNHKNEKGKKFLRFLFCEGDFYVINFKSTVSSFPHPSWHLFSLMYHCASPYRITLIAVNQRQLNLLSDKIRNWIKCWMCLVTDKWWFWCNKLLFSFLSLFALGPVAVPIDLWKTRSTNHIEVLKCTVLTK